MTAVKLLRGQPPSPPQSPNGGSTPDSRLEPCMAFNPANTHPESMGVNGHSTMKLAYDSDPQPLVSLPCLIIAVPVGQHSLTEELPGLYIHPRLLHAQQ